MACHVSLNMIHKQNSDGGLTDIGERTNVTHILQSEGLISQFRKVSDENNSHIKS